MAVAAGFSLVEVLVVLAIIVILIAAAVAIGRSQVEKAKERETLGTLETLDLASQQFAQEDPLGKVRGYRARFLAYAPDELDPFVATPGNGYPSGLRLSPGNGQHVRLPESDEAALAAVDHGDIKAFALAVRTYSEAGATILDRIQPKYRAPAHKDATGSPDEYLDRDGDSVFSPGDEPLDYLVDAWGTPVAYFAIRQGCTARSAWDSAQGVNVQNPGDRQTTSDALLSLSNGVPVFVSYGPDGPEQFSEDFKEQGTYWPDLIYDFNEPEEPGKPPKTIDHPMNADNVYSNQNVRDRIVRLSFEEGIRKGSEN